MKAKYIGKTRDRHTKYATNLFYEYRGYEYMITKYDFDTFETLPVQHKREQERIDRMIEEKNKPKEPVRYEDTTQYALDMFYKYFGE